MMRILFAVLGVVIVGAITFCFWPSQRDIFHDKYVVAGEVRRPINAFAAHLSTAKYLTIYGKKYVSVRGSPPYYLEIPKLNSILFVTENPKHQVTFHIVNLQTKESIEIDGEGSGFGGDIGSGQTPGDRYTDWIDSVNSNTITLATRSDELKVFTVLNLTTKLLERTEVLYFDKNGAVTNHMIYVKGERVK